jgi:hypothetical protein
LICYGVVVADLGVLGGWTFCRQLRKKWVFNSLLIIGFPLVVLLGAGYEMHFRVLGRHFTPLLIIVLLVMGVGLRSRWARRHWASKPLVTAFLILSLASCLMIRFAVRHKKDDYRSAVMVASEALKAGKVVWWSAGREGARYYGLPLKGKDSQSGVISVINLDQEDLRRLPAPDLIVSSKSDIYDNRGALTEYLEENNFVKMAGFPAFFVWQKKLKFAGPVFAELSKHHQERCCSSGEFD